MTAGQAREYTEYLQAVADKSEERAAAPDGPGETAGPEAG
jgi:hypothetical protein